VFGYVPVRLKDVAKVASGNSAPQKESLFKNGIYPFCRTSDVGKIHVSANFYKIADKLNDMGTKGMKLYPKNSILMPKSGASTLLNHRVKLAVDSYVSSHLAVIIANENYIMNEYLYYYLLTIDAKDLVDDINYPSLKLAVIENIKIVLPPLSIQKEIVKALNKFDMVCTNLSNGLPAEIEARKKQYEYYRDKLLSFKKLDK